LCPTSSAADAPEAQYIADTLVERILSPHQAWGKLGLNTAVKPSHRAASKLRIKDKKYTRGLGMHARGELTIDLSGGYKRFEADIGVQWQGGGTRGSVVFQVLVDDEKQFDSAIMKESDPPRRVTVSVEGADELRLVVTDAGDGITSDVADWADARLTPDPDGKRKRARTAVNVAPFARVVTSAPKRMEGTKVTRVQEFPAEDLSVTEELLPAADGSYTVPATKDGAGCIGLEWREFRYFRRVGLRFADQAGVPDGVRLQVWTGRSSWQGSWKPLETRPEKNEDAWTWRIGYEDGRRPTDKIRWIFPATSKPVVVTGLEAHTRSTWKTADIRIEARSLVGDAAVPVEIYNGVFLDSDDGEFSTQRTWHAQSPLRFRVRYARTQRCKTDQTVLRFKLPQTAFGVAVEDVLTNDCVYIPHGGLFVTRDPAPVSLGEYLEQIAGRKTILQRVRELPEQTFAQAMEVVHNPIQDRGPMMLSLACDQRKFVAYRHGVVGFNLNDQTSAVFDGTTNRKSRRFEYKLHATFGDGKYEKLSRHLDGEWLPMPVATVDEDGLLYRYRTYVAPVDDAPIAGAPDWLRRRAVCVIEYTIENTRATDAEAAVVLSVFKEAKKKQRVPLQSIDGGVFAAADERLVVFIDTSKAAPLKVATNAEAATLAGTLPAGATVRCVGYIPAWKLRPDERTLFRGGSDRWAEKVEDYWEDIMAPAARIDLPDELLTNVIRASQVHCMLAAGNEENGRRIDVWTSADRYGALESESQPIIRGMNMMGHQDFARRGLDFFIARYNEQGFLTTGYTMMGSGWHLWTLAEFVDRTQDMAWFKGVAPEVARLCRWIVRQREKTKRLDAHGRKAPNYGLTPPGVIADWGRFTNTAFQAAHYCAGLREAARVLAKIDHPEAAALAEEAEQYRRDILRAYRWTQARSPVVPLDNGTWVPAYPPIFFVFGEVGGFFPGEDGSRAWCKNAMAHHLVVNNIIDPRTEEVSWMLENMEGVEFLRSGLGDYDTRTNHESWFHLGGFNKCQPYYRRNVEIYGLRDEAKPFLRSYFNTIPSLLSRENLSLWEHFHNQGGWNKTHETGWFLCQSRIMLVQERGDDLWLAPFVTRNWLEDGMKVSVQNVPTKFGSVSYAITSAVASGAIEAVIDPPTGSAPNRIVIRVRHPKGTPMRAVTVNGRTHTDFDPKDESASLEPNSERLHVRVAY